MSLGLQNQFREKGMDITPQHWGVLSKLWEADGLHQSNLARKSHKDRHNMTRIVNLLEKNGFIYRKPDQKDKRLLLVYLTEKGRAVQDKMTSVVNEFLNVAFKGLSADELEQIHKIHLHVLANLGYQI